MRMTGKRPGSGEPPLEGRLTSAARRMPSRIGIMTSLSTEMPATSGSAARAGATAARAHRKATAAAVKGRKNAANGVEGKPRTLAAAPAAVQPQPPIAFPRPRGELLLGLGRLLLLSLLRLLGLS